MKDAEAPGLFPASEELKVPVDVRSTCTVIGRACNALKNRAMND